MTPGAHPELVIFSGLQAAGKTSFYRDRFASTHVHVSKDAWPNARNKEDRQRQLVDECLRAGRHVVVDNTNPTALDRAPLVMIAKVIGARAVSYAFITRVADALRRNARREGKARVPDVGILATAKKLVLPARSEGFAACFAVHLTDQGFTVTPREEIS